MEQQKNKLQTKIINAILLVTIFLIVGATGYVVIYFVRFRSLAIIPSFNEFNYVVVKKIPQDYYVNSLLANDLDMDGKKEIVYKNKDLHILDADWRQTCTVPVGESGNETERMLTADVNNDGHQEIITVGSIEDTTTRNYGPYKLQIYDAECKLVQAYTLAEESGQTHGIYYLDLHSDGHPVIVINYDYFGGKIAVINEQGIEIHDVDDIAEQVLGFSRDFSISDIQGDGKKEMIIFGMQGLIITDDNLNMLWNHSVPPADQLENMAVIDQPGSIGQQIAISSSRSNRTYIYNALGEQIKSLSAAGPIGVLKSDYGQRVVIGNMIYDDQYLQVGKIAENPAAIYTNDLDGDGSDEIISLTATISAAVVAPTNIDIYDRNGRNVWHYRYPTWINAMAFEDLGQDGLKEIMVSGHHQDPITIFSSRRIFLK